MGENPDNGGDGPRPIEASLAYALAWGAPLWILDEGSSDPISRSTGAKLRSPRRSLRQRLGMIGKVRARITMHS
jgi:hypothetical protein